MATKDQMTTRTYKLLKQLNPLFTLFFNQRTTDGKSEATLYSYITQLNVWQLWLANELNKKTIEISNEDIFGQGQNEIQDFITYLTLSKGSNGTKRSPKTINNTVQALRSFFRWLAVESSDPKNPGQSYIPTNPMQKVTYKVSAETIKNQVTKMNKMIYPGEEKRELVAWLNNEYENTLPKQARAMFLPNKIRDVAIVATLFATGLRVSELANINWEQDLDIEKREISNIKRKGDHEDTASISLWAVPYLQAWLDRRNDPQGLNVGKAHPALFISTTKHQNHRLSTTQIDRLFKKYTTAFGKPSTPHKARHTFGTDLYRATQSVVDVQEALGQTTDSATKIYIHADQTAQKRAIDNL